MFKLCKLSVWEFQYLYHIWIWCRCLLCPFRLWNFFSFWLALYFLWKLNIDSVTETTVNRSLLWEFFNLAKSWDVFNTTMVPEVSLSSIVFLFFSPLDSGFLLSILPTSLCLVVLFAVTHCYCPWALLIWWSVVGDWKCSVTLWLNLHCLVGLGLCFMCLISISQVI